MIFKAIVVARTDDDNQVYITIPRLDGASSKTNFKGVNKRLATICSLPGCTPIYAPGDVVYVDFEQDNMSIPIVLGSLLSSKSSNSIINLDAESLTVNVNTQLSSDTLIGENKYTSSGSSSNTETSSGDNNKQDIIIVEGVLQGEGSGIISTKPVDNIPEDNSNNLITSGALFNAVKRSDAIDDANIDYSIPMARAISAGDTDLTNGVSRLTSGTVYLYYE